MRIYAPSRMQSVKDMPGQTKLKFRCVPASSQQPAPAALLPALPACRRARPLLGARTAPVCRQPGQNTAEDLAAGDLRSKLEEKERKHYLKTKSTNFEGGPACGAGVRWRAGLIRQGRQHIGAGAGGASSSAQSPQLLPPSYCSPGSLLQ